MTPERSAAELATWDQARVSAIAQKLAKATEKLYATFYKQPLPGMFGGGPDPHQFKDTVRLMHSESLHFAGELEKGEGRDKTLPVFKRLKELNDDAQEYGREIFLANPSLNRFSGVQDLLRQLAPYYDGKR
jgi:hypothetical protein